MKAPQLQQYVFSIDVTFFENTLFLEVHPGIPPIVPTSTVAPTTPPLMVYHRHPQSPTAMSSPDPPASSPTPTSPPPTLFVPGLPIALRKGIWSSHNPNPLYAFFLNYSRLSPTYFSFCLFFGFYVYT